MLVSNTEEDKGTKNGSKRSANSCFSFKEVSELEERFDGTGKSRGKKPLEFSHTGAG
jgi:hypothetical protein|tara:strand:- start:281 stop:451 length:171 start_codon:yes stop_codon:yes gene_type:complete